jgi:Membrane bound beta barrel domain (DUF5777)
MSVAFRFSQPRRAWFAGVCVTASLTAAAPAVAQSGPEVTAARAQDPSPDDATLDPMEPDFTLVNLPTTLRLPVRGGDFHLSHRFNENLRRDRFADAASNLFGLDEGANIALEFRYGVVRHVQAVVQRTSLGRTIQFSAKYDAWHQQSSGSSVPLSISALASIEGDNNFRDNYAPAVGAIVSRTMAERFAVYVTPVFVANTASGGDIRRNTGFIGTGAALRVLSTVYVIGELSPRIAGLAIGDPEFAFSIEKRVGAHAFALTLSNGTTTTYRQLARGGIPQGLYLGFNLSRKFF